MRTITTHPRVSHRGAISLALAAAAIASGIVNTHAAEISVLETGSPLQIILVEGEIVPGDYLRFMDVARDVRRGDVLLSSPGGSLKEGLDIGRVIRQRGYSTAVLSDTVCASSCGLMWLAGTERFMAPSAKVGFHAAYISTTEGVRETGMGNAMVGAYLTELGLPIEAVMFSTMMGPDQMSWLTLEDARRVGIEVELLKGELAQPAPDLRETTIPDLQGPADTAAMPLVLPAGYRWIVMQSGLNLHALPVTRARDSFGSHSVAVVKSSNGYYALVLGPFDERDAESRIERLKESGAVPPDAYLSSGKRFIARIE